MLTGASILVIRALTLDETLTTLVIPGTWVKLYFTAKGRNAAQDTDAMIQIQVSNPADAAHDGLIIISGRPAVLAQGSLTPNLGAGTCQVVVNDEATALLEELEFGFWDLKVLLADGTSHIVPHGSGPFAISLTPTRSVS
jgi:hypothetical protein